MNTLDHLPPELLSLILAHVDKSDLYTCLVISKPFYKESMPLLWRRLDIHSHQALTHLTTTMATSPHAPGIHVRSVSMTFQLASTDLLALTQHVPLLEHLDLQHAQNITDTSFKHVPRHCPHLTTLDINRGEITLLSMVALGQSCHQLGRLRLTFCPYLDYPPLFSALRGCPLTEMDITPCDMYRMESRHFAEAAALRLHHYQPLTSLWIQNSDNDYTAFIAAANAHHLTWPHLTHLCLDACHTVDDTMAIPFLQAHPGLVTLELKGTHITDRTLDAMAMYLPHLKKVVVHNNPRLTAAGLCRLVKHGGGGASLTNGVWCLGCGIYLDHDDFPEDLDRRFYALEDVDERPEVIWLAGNAFDDTSSNHHGD